MNFVQTQPSVLTIGIDPGVTGAFALLPNDGRPAEVLDSPFIKVKRGKNNRHEVDEDGLIELFDETIRRFHDYRMVAVLEDVHAMPINGSIGSFALGSSKASWRIILKYNKIPIILVHANIWKKQMGLAGKEKEDSIQMAKKSVSLSTKPTSS